MWARLLLALFALGATFPGAAAEKTLAELEQMAIASPGSAEAWDRYGLSLAYARRFKEAQEALNHALSYAPPDNKPILHHLALVHAWSGNYQEAVRRYSQLLQRFPHDTAIRIDYGQSLAWDRRYDEATTQYKEVLESEPRNVEALRHMGVLEAWQGRYGEALAQLERGLAIDPQNPKLVADRAEVLTWKGDLAEAAKAYETLIQLNPETADHWLKLAQVYTWHGRTRQARESYEHVLSLNPGNIDAYIGIAHVYLDNHQYAEAYKVLREALHRFPNDPRLTKELSALAAKQSLSLDDMVELIEPLIFVAILLVLARHIWRYRRVLRRRHLAVRVLLPALPALALLIVVVYIFVLLGGAYYREASAATQLLELVALGALLVLTLTLVWLLRFERPQRQQKVLAIGAHPDDIEFGCGATLLRLREEGAKTYGLVLTIGERGHNESAVSQVRIEEARAAARVIALSDIAFHNFPDTNLHEHKEAIRVAIEDALARWQPDIIFTHNSHDVHTDHRTVFDATLEAARGAYTILCYENPNTPPAFHPGYFIDVSGYIEDKITALAHHKTQMGKTYADSAVIRATAGFRGNQVRVPFAEGFEAVRVLEKASVS